MRHIQYSGKAFDCISSPKLTLLHPTSAMLQGWSYVGGPVILKASVPLIAGGAFSPTGGWYRRTHVRTSATTQPILEVEPVMSIHTVWSCHWKYVFPCVPSWRSIDLCGWDTSEQTEVLCDVKASPISVIRSQESDPAVTTYKRRSGFTMGNRIGEARATKTLGIKDLDEWRLIGRTNLLDSEGRTRSREEKHLRPHQCLAAFLKLSERQDDRI